MLYRNHGSHFENAKTAFEEGGGRDELADVRKDLTELEMRDWQDSMEKGKVCEEVEIV